MVSWRVLGVKSILRHSCVHGDNFQSEDFKETAHGVHRFINRSASSTPPAQLEQSEGDEGGGERERQRLACPLKSPRGGTVTPVELHGMTLGWKTILSADYSILLVAGFYPHGVRMKLHCRLLRRTKSLLHWKCDLIVAVHGAEISYLASCY